MRDDTLDRIRARNDELKADLRRLIGDERALGAGEVPAPLAPKPAGCGVKHANDAESEKENDYGSAPAAAKDPGGARRAAEIGGGVGAASAEREPAKDASDVGSSIYNDARQAVREINSTSYTRARAETRKAESLLLAKIDRQSEEIEELRRKVQRLKTQNGSLQQENLELHETLDASERQHRDQMQQMVVRFQAKLKQYEQANSEMFEQVQAANDIKDRFKQEAGRSNDKVESLRHIVHMMSEDLKQSEHENTKAKKRIHDLQTYSQLVKRLVTPPQACGAADDTTHLLAGDGTTDLLLRNRNKVSIEQKFISDGAKYTSPGQRLRRAAHMVLFIVRLRRAAGGGGG